mmetsp:Transcript_60901/g.175468  ORF Transcript_60901/g.175468 Transcript_60901/m.175468 type:complete len:223 (-) Transcript_60901:625-1293(-)
MVHAGNIGAEVPPRQAHPPPGLEARKHIPQQERRLEDGGLRHLQGNGVHRCLREDLCRHSLLLEPRGYLREAVHMAVRYLGHGMHFVPHVCAEGPFRCAKYHPVGRKDLQRPCPASAQYVLGLRPGLAVGHDEAVSERAPQCRRCDQQTADSGGGARHARRGAGRRRPEGEAQSQIRDHGPVRQVRSKRRRRYRPTRVGSGVEALGRKRLDRRVHRADHAGS